MCIVDIDSGELEFPEELPGFPYEQEQSLLIILYAFTILYFPVIPNTFCLQELFQRLQTSFVLSFFSLHFI